MKDMIVDEDLAATLREEAKLAELEEDTDEDVWVPRKGPRRPSMVYSIRIPVGRVEELRQVAAAAGLDPSAMVRQWVLERLDSEQSQGSEEEDLASLILATVSEMKKTGWSVMFTPHPEGLKPFMLKVPAGAGASAKTTTRGAAKSATSTRRAAAAKKVPAKAAVAKKVAAKAAAIKKVAGRTAATGKVAAKAGSAGKMTAKAAATGKVPAKAAPRKRAKPQS